MAAFIQSQTFSLNASSVKHIIGRDGWHIKKIKNFANVDVQIHNETENCKANLIITGTAEAIEKAVSVINHQLVVSYFFNIIPL